MTAQQAWFQELSEIISMLRGISAVYRIVKHLCGSSGCACSATRMMMPTDGPPLYVASGVNRLVPEVFLRLSSFRGNDLIVTTPFHLFVWDSYSPATGLSKAFLSKGRSS